METFPNEQELAETAGAASTRWHKRQEISSLQEDFGTTPAVLIARRAFGLSCTKLTGFFAKQKEKQIQIKKKKNYTHTLLYF